MSKKYFTIFLLSIFIFNAIGLEVVFAFLFYKVKSEALEEISSNVESEITLIINSENINRFSKINDKEFLFDGVMYDARSLEETKDGLIIRCEKDLKEQNLISLFSKSVDKSESGSSKKPQNRFLSKNIIKNYINPESSKLLFNQDFTQIFYTANLTYEQPQIAKLSPPPQTT